MTGACTNRYTSKDLLTIESTLTTLAWKMSELSHFVQLPNTPMAEVGLKADKINQTFIYHAAFQQSSMHKCYEKVTNSTRTSTHLLHVPPYLIIYFNPRPSPVTVIFLLPSYQTPSKGKFPLDYFSHPQSYTSANHHRCPKNSTTPHPQTPALPQEKQVQPPPQRPSSKT